MKKKRKSATLGSATHTHMQKTLEELKAANGAVDNADSALDYMTGPGMKPTAKGCALVEGALFQATRHAGAADAHRASTPASRRLPEDADRMREQHARFKMSVDRFRRQCFRSSAIPARLSDEDDASTKRFKLLELDGPRRRRGRR